MINQSSSLFDQGKYNESLLFYDKVIELDSSIDTIWRCKCSAMYILAKPKPSTTSGDDLYYPSGELRQPATEQSVMEERSREEDVIAKCMECDYDADQAELKKNPGLESLKRDMETAKASVDEEREKKST